MHLEGFQNKNFLTQEEGTPLPPCLGLNIKTLPFGPRKHPPEWKFAHLLIWRNLSVKWRKIFILLAEAPFLFMVTLCATKER